MIKLNKREKHILYVVIILFSLLFLERLVFRPLADKLAYLDKEIEIEKMKLIKAKAVAGQKVEILKEYSDLGNYMKIKGSDEEATSELLKEIEKLARESSVSISDIKPRSAQKRGISKEYSIEVRTETKMPQLVDFLYSLDNSTSMLRVQKLSLILSEETSDILRVTLLISGISLN
jgi:hypothetical protein